jgi:predicted metal-binding membrane protein
MAVHDITLTERVIGRDRVIIAIGLSALTLLSWIWVLAGAGTGMSSIAITTWQFPPPVVDGTVMAWTPLYAVVMLMMWWIMMIAMMIPSAAPMILLYGQVARHARSKGQMDDAALHTSVFILGYIAA